MINVDHGDVTVKGTIIELCADMTTAYVALLNTMPNGDDMQKGVSTTLLKALFFDMAHRTAKKGFNVHFTEKEIGLYPL